MSLSRRNFLCKTSAGLLGLPFAPALLGANVPPLPGSAPAPELAPRGPKPLNRYPRMLQEWAVEQVRQAEARGDAARERLASRADAEAYVASVRQRIAESLGPLPARTPLNAKVVGSVAGQGFTIEKIIFESRPDFWVTGNLYLPAERAGKMPAVLGLCGHWEDSKADAENHQTFAQGLVQQGYVCFLIDPIGQGGANTASISSPISLRHFVLACPSISRWGINRLLVGDFLGTVVCAWDGMRALDYLESRPEVDSRRLGATGCSGGGTQTAYLCALDPRLAMAAPACFITTFRRNLENELPVDPEQCPPRALALGLDHSDFIAAFAPRPAILLAQEHDDIFDVRGTITAFRRLQRLYDLLGQPENIQLHIGPDHHGYSRSCREAMYRWFNRAAGIPGAGDEPPVHALPAQALWCTSRGQVMDLHSRTVMSFTAESAQRLTAGRPALRGAALTQAVRQTLRLPPVADAAPDYRILRSAGPRQYPERGLLHLCRGNRAGNPSAADPPVFRDP